MTKKELIEKLNDIYSELDGVVKRIKNIRDDFGEVVQDFEDNGLEDPKNEEEEPEDK